MVARVLAAAAAAAAVAPVEALLVAVGLAATAAAALVAALAAAAVDSVPHGTGLGWTFRWRGGLRAASAFSPSLATPTPW